MMDKYKLPDGNVIAADADFIAAHHPGAVLFTTSPPPPPATTLAEYKVSKIAAIRAHFNGLVAALKADAAPYEIDTWPVQTVEYSAWIANSAIPVPYVSALATARGITVSALMDKIGIKVYGLATLQGTQHALETAVLAAATNAAVDAVVW